MGWELALEPALADLLEAAQSCPSETDSPVMSSYFGEISMTLPITGPYYWSDIVSVPEVGSHYIDRTWYRQKRPYDRPLTFRFQKVVCTGASGAYKHYGWANGAAFTGNNFYDAFCYLHDDAQVLPTRNTALLRFNGSVGDRADWATTLVQREQSIQMIAKRALQFRKALSAMRRGDFGTFAHTLGLAENARKPPPNWRKRAKKPGDLWLEYSYGWKPLISDIGTAVDVLQSDFSLRKVKGSAKDVSFNRYTPYVFPGSYQIHSNIYRSVKYKIQADIRITNPNLYLANRLGFTNPASVVWELVPWSFVVDWFVPVGAFLSSFTEYLGLTVENPSSTLFVTEMVWSELQSLNVGIPSASQTKVAITCDRRLNLPGISLTPRFSGRISANRAANAISLLLQQLGKTR